MDAIPTFAMARRAIIDWQVFVSQNDWAGAALENGSWLEEQVPEHCIAIFFVIDRFAMVITHRLYAVTWTPEYKFREAFRNLNWAWIERLFNIEATDVQLLEHPQSIIDDGGEIFFLLHGDVVAGTVALVVEHGEYELNNMSIANNYLGLGFAHALMRVALDWARIRGIPGITILSNTTLESALSLYQQYGFQVIHHGSQQHYTRCNVALRLCM